MPPVRRRAIALRRPMPRRRLTWADTLFTDNSRTGGTLGTVDLLANYVSMGGDKVGATVMRVHATGSYAPAAVGDHMTFGILVETFGADPVVAPYDEWMLQQYVWPGASGATVDAVTVFSIDLRSRRRLRTVSDSLQFSWKPTTGTTNSLDIHFRVLLALA